MIDAPDRWLHFFAVATADDYHALLGRMKQNEYADHYALVELAERLGVKIVVVPARPLWTVTDVDPLVAADDRRILLGNDDHHFVWLRPFSSVASASASASSSSCSVASAAKRSGSELPRPAAKRTETSKTSQPPPQPSQPAAPRDAQTVDFQWEKEMAPKRKRAVMSFVETNAGAWPAEGFFAEEMWSQLGDEQREHWKDARALFQTLCNVASACGLEVGDAFRVHWSKRRVLLARDASRPFDRIFGPCALGIVQVASCGELRTSQDLSPGCLRSRWRQTNASLL